MEAINGKVVCRFAVSVSGCILCIAWIQRDFVIRDFRLLRSKGKKSLEKVISLTFRTNKNLHMFRDEVVVKKEFLSSAGVFSPRKLPISISF